MSGMTTDQLAVDWRDKVQKPLIKNGVNDCERSDHDKDQQREAVPDISIGDSSILLKETAHAVQYTVEEDLTLPKMN